MAQVAAYSPAHIQPDTAGAPVQPPVLPGIAHLEHPWQILRRDAYARIRDAQLVPLPVYADSALLPRVFQGVAQDIQEDLEDDIPEEEEDEADEEEDEMFLDEESLDECLTALARKYMKEGKGIRARTLSGKIVEGNLILSGRCNRKGYTITVENFNKAISEASRKVVLSATTDLFNNCKLNIGAIKEGNKLTVKKVGYGMITESANRKVKVTGIIG